MIETRPFDPARYITTREAAAAYMEGALKDRDADEIVDALDVVARALGLREPGLTREAEFEQILEALEGLGLTLSLQPAAAAA